jgi:hypothetical protein
MKNSRIISYLMIWWFLADNIAVRELLIVANFFYEALQLARKGGDNNEPSLYGIGGQVNE